MKLLKLTWHIKDYDKKRAIGDRNFKKKIFLGYLDGKKHYSIGRGASITASATLYARHLGNC